MAHAGENSLLADGHGGGVGALRAGRVGGGAVGVRRRARGRSRRPGRAGRPRPVALVARPPRGGDRPPPARRTRRTDAGETPAGRECSRRISPRSTGSMVSTRRRRGGSPARTGCSPMPARSPSSAGSRSRRRSDRRIPSSPSGTRRRRWRLPMRCPTRTSSAWRSRSSDAPSSGRVASRMGSPCSTRR